MCDKAGERSQDHQAITLSVAVKHRSDCYRPARYIIIIMSATLILDDYPTTVGVA